ncbi:MAG: hypothetical protein ACLU9S_11235 [Oscillospiraceae bacterium]
MDDASERNEIYAGIASSVNTLAQNYGIEVVDVKIKTQPGLAGGQ